MEWQAGSPPGGSTPSTASSTGSPAVSALNRADEALERALLARRVECPRRVVVAGAVRDAEQALKPTVRREGVPFEVEEHVAVRRHRQRREPLVGLDRRDELVDAAALAARCPSRP